MYKYIYPLIKCKIKPWLKYYIVKKGEGTPSEIITSASPITLVNSLRRKFIKFIVGGNSIQDGEPSPATPVEIQNVTGNVEVKVENKNIFNSENNIWGKYDVWQHNAGTYSNAFINTFNVKGGNVCSISFNSNASIRFSYQFIDNNNNYLKGYYLDAPIKTKIFANISIPINATKVIASQLDGKQTDEIQIQFEYNSSATDYVPHEEQTAIFPLEEGQILHEGDTIEDKIVQKRKTIVFDGTEDWTANGSYNNQYYRYIPTLNDRKKNGTGLSNYFSVINNIDSVGLYNGIGVNFIIEGIETVADWKAWLAEKYANGTPLTLEYELETPIETEFTEAQRTAKTQIDKLYSYKGTTHISSTNEPSPIFEVQYYMEGE